MFSVRGINKHLAKSGESAAGTGRRRKKSGKKLKKLTGGRVQSDGRGGITLKGKRSKNISLAGLRKRKGAPGPDVGIKKKQKRQQFQPGMKVRLSHPSFTGKIAIVDKYLERKKKYGLRLKKNGKKVSLHAEFLSPMETQQEAKKKKSGLTGLFTKKITQEPQEAAETSSGARVTFSGGQITLNKSAKGKGKAAAAPAGRKRKQVDGGLASKALLGLTVVASADGARVAKRAKKTANSTPARPQLTVIKIKKKKKVKKKIPKKAGLGPQIDHYQAKGGALVLVRNLPKSVAGHHLIMDLFPEAGEILSSIVHTDSKGKSTGSGEVHFARLSQAQKAIAELRGTIYGGNKISMTLIGTQQGGRMASEVVVEKGDVDSEDEYESEYDDDVADAQEEHKEEPAEADAEESQASQEEQEGEPEEEEEEEEDVASQEPEPEEVAANEESAVEESAGEDQSGMMEYIEPSDSEDDETSEGPEFHVTLKGGLGLQG